MIAFSRSFNSNRCSVNACPSNFSPQPSHRLFPPKCITSPSSSGAPQSSTDHKLFKERLVGEVLPKHVDVLEDGLDDCVDVPLPVVRQLHRYQHQTEPDTISIMVVKVSKCRDLAMKKFLCVATTWWASPFFFRWESSEPGPRWPNKLLRYLRVQICLARNSVECLPARTRLIMLIIVLKGEGEVEVIHLVQGEVEVIHLALGMCNLIGTLTTSGQATMLPREWGRQTVSNPSGPSGTPGWALSQICYYCY